MNLSTPVHTRPSRRVGAATRLAVLLGSALAFAPVTTPAQLTSYRDLHDFGGAISHAGQPPTLDGNGPNGNVAFDQFGNVFGTSTEGGAYGVNGNAGGMVWYLGTKGDYLDLHDFGGTIKYADGTSGPDGNGAVAGPTVDNLLNVYGTTINGGEHGGGIVFEISSRGYMDLHDFGGTLKNADGSFSPDGSQASGGVVLDAQGNLYGVTRFGGANNSGILWKLTPKGVYTDLHDFGGKVTNADGKTGNDGAIPMAGLTFDSAGNLYGTTWQGGPYESDLAGGIVFEYKVGGAYADLHDFGGTTTYTNGQSGTDGRAPECAVTFDAAGDMYGTASGGGRFNGGILWEIPAGKAYKDIHDFGQQVQTSGGPVYLDGAAPVAGVTVDKAGNLYGTTSEGGSDLSMGTAWGLFITGGYQILHTFGGSIIGPDGEPQPDGEYPNSSPAIDGGGNLYGVAYNGGSHHGGMLWVLSGGLKKISASPNPIVGGTPGFGAVTLGTAAPIGGTVVYLASGNALVSPPPYVFIPAGATSGQFSIVPETAPKPTDVTLSAFLENEIVTTTLTILPPSLTSVGLNATTLTGGSSTHGTVTLNGPAPINGIFVGLTSNSALATVPAKVYVPENATSGMFTVATSGVGSKATATIAASLGAVSKHVTLTIVPVALASVAVLPSTTTGGESVIGLISLNGPALSAVTVNLSDNSSVVSVPQTVTIAAGKTQATFTVKTSAVSVTKVVTISAAYAGVTETAKLTVNK
jgi:uncharacterized repeat protein (TIGR03803 family)